MHPGAKDILHSLLHSDPDVRYTAGALLRHPRLYSAQGLINPYEAPRQPIAVDWNPSLVAGGQSSLLDADSPVSVQTPGVRRNGTAFEDTAGDVDNWELIEAGSHAQAPGVSRRDGTAVQDTTLTMRTGPCLRPEAMHRLQTNRPLLREASMPSVGQLTLLMELLTTT